MERTPLNKAHQLERRAEILNRQKKFDECVQCHREAADLLAECCKLTDNPITLESVRLQKEWNEKQIRTIQLKKSYLEKCEKEKSQEVVTKNSQKDVENLETKIFRAIETHDSLICYLGQRGIIDTGTDKNSLNKKDKDEKEGSPPVIGNKRPKDDSIVIEELKVLSGQLRESVHELLIQLDDRNREIEKLKATIRALELEKTKDESKENLNLKVANDSSGGTSPFVFSPSSESSADVLVLENLPPLEPLQMPNFDLHKLRQLNSPNT